MRKSSYSPDGFTLVELLTVIAILAILAGAASMSMGDNRSKGINVSTAQVGGALSMARDLAVSSNRRVRFAIVTGDSTNPEDWRLRKYGTLQQNSLDPTSTDWKLTSSFSQLPTGVYFGEYSDAAQGSQMFTRKATTSVQGQNVAYCYIEFLPSGAANDASGSNIFSIAGRASADQEIINTANVASLGVAQHTGRVRIERPE